MAQTLRDIFAGAALPKVREVRQVLAVERILRGEPAEVVATDFKLQRRGLEALAAQVAAQGLPEIAPDANATIEQNLAKRRLGIAQILLGVLAERRFEAVIEEVTGGGILQIEDHRPSRTDTDYRLLNGGGNPICRFNIKFHGSLFREARRFVALEPEDCFALAAYKIHNALRRQEAEKLPYIFLVLSVPALSAGDVGRLVPDDFVWVLAVQKTKLLRLVQDPAAFANLPTKTRPRAVWPKAVTIRIPTPRIQARYITNDDVDSFRRVGRVGVEPGATYGEYAPLVTSLAASYPGLLERPARAFPRYPALRGTLA
jgi:hypothetical protein